MFLAPIGSASQEDTAAEIYLKIPKCEEVIDETYCSGPSGTCDSVLNDTQCDRIFKSMLSGGETRAAETSWDIRTPKCEEVLDDTYCSGPSGTCDSVLNDTQCDRLFKFTFLDSEQRSSGTHPEIYLKIPKCEEVLDDAYCDGPQGTCESVLNDTQCDRFFQFRFLDGESRAIDWTGGSSTDVHLIERF